MRSPRYDSVDIMTPAAVRDPMQASVTALRMPAFQHALMSGWGGPPQVSTLYASTETEMELTRSYRVPPGVTEVDVEVRGSGNGGVILTTAADATGVTLWFANDFTSAVAGVYMQQDLRGGRLTVLAAPVWEWTDVDVLVQLGASAGPLETYTLTVYPHHVPR